MPVLLSVGYAACHWCHVMAHESFEDEEVAARAQRPLRRRQGRPRGAARHRHGLHVRGHRADGPGRLADDRASSPRTATRSSPAPTSPATHFLRCCTAPSTRCGRTRERRGASPPGATSPAPLREALGAPSAARRCARRVSTAQSPFCRLTSTRRAGGFGGAPKFPPSMVLEFLLRHHARTGRPTRSADGRAHLRGDGPRRDVRPARRRFRPLLRRRRTGSCRTSRRCSTTTPCCCGSTPHLWRTTGDPLARRVAEETADFLLRDLRTDEGGFASALDADTVVDGARTRASPTPGPRRSSSRCSAPVDGARGRRLLRRHRRRHLRARHLDPAAAHGPRRPRLVAATVRAGCSRPARSAPSRAATTRSSRRGTAWPSRPSRMPARSSSEPDWSPPPSGAPTFVLDVHLVDGRCCGAPRAVGWSARRPACSTTTATSRRACSRCTRRPVRRGGASSRGGCSPKRVERFAADDGGFHDTAHDARAALPAPAERRRQRRAVRAVRSRRCAGDAWRPDRRPPQRLEAGAAPLEAGLGLAVRDPRFGGWTLAVAEALAAGPLQVAVVGDGSRRRTGSTPLGCTVEPRRWWSFTGLPDTPGIPLLADRPLVEGHPAAYVCRGFVCDLPA